MSVILKLVNQKSFGFTLVEIIVIVALLGGLAIGFIGGLDPFEQIKKGVDTTRMSTANSVYGAILDYFASHKTLPYSTDITGESLDSEAGDAIIQTLVTSGELKANFAEYNAKLLNHLYITATNDGKTLAICFQPDSKSYQSVSQHAVNGQPGQDCTTTHLCFSCAGDPPEPTDTPTPSPPGTTVTPQITATPTPTPTPSLPISDNCEGQMLRNASFEIDTNGDRFPDGWTPDYSTSISRMRNNEGIICNDIATHGSCSYVALPWANTGGTATIAKASQSFPTSLGKDSAYKLSMDIRAVPVTDPGNGVPSAAAGAELTYIYTDNTKDVGRTDMIAVDDDWSKWEYTMRAGKNLKRVDIRVYNIAPDNRTYAIDNVCLKKYNFSVQQIAESYCPGQLLINGSFEEPTVQNSQIPFGWTYTNNSSAMQPDEGRKCDAGSSGSCGYVHQTSPPYNYLTQTIPISGKKGDTFTFSADTKIEGTIVSWINGYTNISVGFEPLILFRYKNLEFMDWYTSHWKRASTTFVAWQDYTAITIRTFPPTSRNKIRFDSVCLQRE